MGWLHNAKLKRRADEAFYEGSTVLFRLPGPLKETPIEDVHRAIINAVIHDFFVITGIDITNDFISYIRVYEASCYAAVMIKCGEKSHYINLPFITADGSGPKHINMNMTPAPTPEAPPDGRS